MVYYQKEDTEKAVWNMDDSVLKTLWSLKNSFINQMLNNELENAYRTLRNIRMEAEAKFNKKEREFIKIKINELELMRRKYLKDKNYYSGEFYAAIETTYIILNRLMKSNGMYFREAEEDSGL